VAARVIARLIEKHGSGQIAVAAPTGKAAVRITELMQSYGVGVKARTIHSLLRVESHSEGDGWGFHHNENEPLPYKFIVVDECFPPGTMVDCPGGQKPIEQIKPSDEIYNGIGVDCVIATKRKEIKRVVKITCGKTKIFCSENHRFLTTRGFIVASQLGYGDPFIQTTEAMRLLRGVDTAFPFERRHQTVLQHILLNEMVDAARGIPQKDLHAGEGSESGGRTEAFSSVGHGRSKEADQANLNIESNERPAGPAVDFTETESHRSQTESSGREWQGANDSPAAPAGYSPEIRQCGLASRDHSFDKQTTGPSEWHQDRYWQQAEEDLHRVRRPFPYCGEGPRAGCKEGFISSIDRVHRIEILEQDDPQLDQFRDADGKLYFYDLQAARHQTFSVEGLLVHNCSMIDTDLAAALFRSCATGTHMLLIGDTGQLPPVGHGAPLRDLIAAGVPTGRLTEIRRNSGAVVHACHEIRAGRRFQVCPQLRPEAGENLRVLPAVSSKAALEKIVQTIRSIGSKGLANPVWECQVIVAVNAKSELSRQAVNQRLQAELNPGGGRAAGNPFRVGDKIVCLKNSFLPVVEDAPPEFNQEEDDGKVFVANGEQGCVKHVQSKLTIAQLDGPPRLIKIPRGTNTDSQGDGDGANSDESAATGCQWDLAYGISCHKSQGSEWPVVLVALDEYPGARLVCSREWLYTAISRAKLACFLVGKLATGHGMIQREAIRKRKTFLRELIENESGRPAR
jgi:hypothetical protein